MDSLWRKAAEFLYHRRKDKRWRTIVTCLAAVVVFVTTYALILPAITMDDETAEQEPGVVLVQDEAAAEAAIAEAEPAEAQVSEEEVPIESEGSEEEEFVVIDSDDGGDDIEADDSDAEEADIQLIDVTVDESTEPMTKTYQDDEIEVTATYGAEANIPEEAEFRVTKLAVEETAEVGETAAEESEEIEEIEAADAAEVTERYRYDIGFYVGEEEIEPENTVSLSIRFLAGQFAEAEEITAVHYLDDNDPSDTETIQPEVNEDQDGNVQAQFDMESFSVVEFQGTAAASENAQADSEETVVGIQTSDAPSLLANTEAGTFTLTYQGSVITVHCVDNNNSPIPSNVNDLSTNQYSQTFTFAEIKPNIEGYEYQSAHWENYNGTEITSVTTAAKWQNMQMQYGWTTSASNTLYTTGDVYLVYQQDSGERTVTFDTNGATGEAPAAKTVPVGETITFPDQNTLSRDGYSFVGWSTDKDANESGVEHNCSPVYSAGSEYTVEGNQTFYAIWGKNSTTGTFYIALDGSIRNEPRTTSDNDNASWTYGAELTGAIKVAKFYNNQTGVEDNLDKTPSNEQLAGMINNAIGRGNTIQVNNGDGTKDTILGAVVVNGELYAAKNATGSGESTGEKLYVRWYVVKNVSGGTVLYVDDQELTNPSQKNPNSEWHIDGVLQKEGKVLLMYEVNAPASTYDRMPDGSSYTPGTTGVKAGNHNGDNTNLIEPVRSDGYVFAGWKMYTPDENGNLKYNSDGTVTGIDKGIYQTGDIFTINENTLLVAQWVKDTTSLKVQKTDEDGKLIDTATFTLDNTEKQTENGVADFGKIELNTRYALKETAAPDGYEIRTDTIYFEETKNGSTYTVTYYKDANGSETINRPSWVNQELVAGNLTLSISDERSKATIEIKKKESGTSTLLPNAEFTLYRLPAEGENDTTTITDADGEEITVVKVENVDPITTDEDGLAQIENLPTGAYYLVETKAPDGYNQLEKAIRFSLSTSEIDLSNLNNNMATVEDKFTLVVSNSAGRELPHTGGSGTTLFTFGGLAILAGCLMAGYSMRRKWERRSE